MFTRRTIAVICEIAGFLGLMILASSCRTSSRDAALLREGFSREQIHQYRADRERLARSAHRVLFDNDGCDAAYYPSDRAVTPQGLLDIRTTPLIDSQVDTLCYCTISSGFSLFTHNTKVGQILDYDLGMWAGHRNITTDLIASGTDPLAIMVEFCHAHDLACFWSMRMNDTHDQAQRPDKPYPLFPRLKKEHPEVLNGSYERQPSYGSWTSVNYALPEVRDLAFRYLEEVCERYDVDGIELDFFRHMSYLKSVAWGGEASPEEIAGINAFMERVRTMTERIGLRRGRPILVAARVPDSSEYAKRVGLDIETWMAEGWVDMMIGSGYFRLRPWSDWVALGQRYDAVMVAGLSESRVAGEDKRFHRMSAESYRARAMQAWQAGVDALYIFNIYNAGSSWLKEVGDPERLRRLDKQYFATVRDGRPGSYLKNGDRFRVLPTITPTRPLDIETDACRNVTLRVGDDIAALRRDPAPPKATCHLRFAEPLSPAALMVRLNGTVLPGATAKGDWLDVPVPLDCLRQGVNHFAFKLADHALPSASTGWRMEYVCDHVLAMPSQLPWRRAFASCNYKEKIVDGALLLADRDTGEKTWPHLAYPWNIRPGDDVLVEARLKVVRSDRPLAVCLRLSNGKAVEYVTFEPHRVGLHFADLAVPFDTTSAFHTYGVRIHGEDITVYADGKAILVAPHRYTTPAADETHWLDLLYGLRSWNRRCLYLGSASGPGTGEAMWKFIRFRSTSNVALLKDLVLRLDFP